MSSIKVQTISTEGGIPVIENSDDGTVTFSEGFAMPSGTTAERPASPDEGAFYYNTDNNAVEIYHSTGWISNLQKLTATGGTETTITDGGIEYRVHTFTSSGTLIVKGEGEVEYLAVAGGGGGANGGANVGGAGGGAGGYLSGSLSVSSGAITCSVGASGGSGTSGSNSQFGDITAIGGGGATPFADGKNGGSGAGAPGNRSAGSGTAGQGFSGAIGVGVVGSTPCSAGGGGGAGSAGVRPSAESTTGAGGSGLASSINGTSTVYAIGGTGAAGDGDSSSPPAKSSNTGNGGDGGGGGGGTGGAGGSGIVIIRYPV